MKTFWKVNKPYQRLDQLFLLKTQTTATTDFRAKLLQISCHNLFSLKSKMKPHGELFPHFIPMLMHLGSPLHHTYVDWRVIWLKDCTFIQVLVMLIQALVFSL